MKWRMAWRFVPLDEATTPRDGFCLTDRWWLVHPDLGLLFYGSSPQCNSDRAMFDGRYRPDLSDVFDKEISDKLTVIFVPVVYGVQR